MKKNLFKQTLICAMSLFMVSCGTNTVNQEVTTVLETSSPIVSETPSATIETTSSVKVDGTTINTSELFTERDLEQEPDLTNVKTITLKDNEDVSITEEGTYVVAGNVKEVTITVEVTDSDKVQLVLDDVTITNTDFPCIYVKNADKVFVTTTNTTNNLSVTGSFISDGDIGTDAVIYSKDDLVLNGVGSIIINSSDNGVVSKDDLKVTGGTLDITCANNALRGNDSVVIYDGNFTINSKDDGIHAEDNDDTNVGYVYIANGTFNINASDDAIHATTILQLDGGTYTLNGAEALEATYIRINDGKVIIQASDDGINASTKSTFTTPTIEINGGDITISMAQGDTDAIDSNGNINVNGGTITINAQFAFDFDGKAELNGGTVIVNGNEVTQITNAMMGGFGQGGMFGGNQGDMPPQGGFHGGRGH